ncbi:MAG: hypothetical protein AB1758_06855 [Candidatus Eremiobacterota bacterium]
MAKLEFLLSATVRGVSPPISRMLVIPSRLSLEQVHDVLQMALGWSGQEQFAFFMDEYNLPSEAMAEEVLETGAVMTYQYGEHWQLGLAVLAEHPGPDSSWPRCLQGERCGPPESCPGPGPYMGLLQNLQHPTRKRMVERWHGDFHPERFDLEQLNESLARKFLKRKEVTPVLLPQARAALPDPEALQAARDLLLNSEGDLLQRGGQALDMSPLVAESWLVLAEAAMRPSQAVEASDQAIACAERLLAACSLDIRHPALDPVRARHLYLESWLELLWAKTWGGRAEEAARDARDILKRIPWRGPEVMVSLATALLAAGRSDEIEPLVPEPLPEALKAPWLALRALAAYQKGLPGAGELLASVRSAEEGFLDNLLEDTPFGWPRRIRPAFLLTRGALDWLKRPVPTAADPLFTPRALERLNLRQLMLLALRERGGPMTMEEVAERLTGAGAVLPHGITSLRKAWRKAPPIRETLDGRLELDPDHPEYPMADFTIKEALRPPLPQHPPREPVPDGPFTRGELDLLARYEVSRSQLSRRRLATVILEVLGGEAEEEAVRQELALLGHKGGFTLDSVLGPVVGRQGSRLVLHPERAEIIHIRRVVRKWLSQRPKTVTASSPSPELLAERESRRQETRAWFHEACRAVIRLVFHGKEAAGCLLRQPEHQVVRFLPQQRASLQEALAGLDVVVGLAPRDDYERLGLERGARRFVDLSLPWRELSDYEFRIEEFLRMTVPVQQPLASLAELREWWEAGQWDAFFGRLEQDLEVLNAYYRYGVLHEGVRFHYLQDGPRLLGVQWNLGHEPTLRETLERAASGGRPVRLAVRPRRPLRPEESMREFEPQDLSYWEVRGRWVDSGQGEVLPLSEIAAVEWP